jgi:hypothetical protein
MILNRKKSFERVANYCSKQIAPESPSFVTLLIAIVESLTLIKFMNNKMKPSQMDLSSIAE